MEYSFTDTVVKYWAAFYDAPKAASKRTQGNKNPLNWPRITSPGVCPTPARLLNQSASKTQPKQQQKGQLHPACRRWKINGITKTRCTQCARSALLSNFLPSSFTIHPFTNTPPYRAKAFRGTEFRL